MLNENFAKKTGLKENTLIGKSRRTIVFPSTIKKVKKNKSQSCKNCLR